MPHIYLNVESLKHWHRNKRAQLQRLARTCPECRSGILEYLWKFEQWIKQVEERGQDGIKEPDQ